ncbi:MAG TPA: hypothetical protein VNX65_00210 [Patescibacteria group bacterium]|jgi:hypothetical protein|nr:hypothetical protein [Patescibacteria group bacterium]
MEFLNHSGFDKDLKAIQRKHRVAIPKSGLRPGQWPRVWFVVSGENIVFLTIAMHAQNYSDNDMQALAKTRATDFF